MSTKRMNKLELTQALKDSSDLPKPEAAAVVDTLFSEIAGTLAKGELVEIRVKIDLMEDLSQEID